MAAATRQTPNAVQNIGLGPNGESFKNIHGAPASRNRVHFIEGIFIPNDAIRIENMRIPVFYVDAFTKQPFHGNPAAVCFLDSWLDDGQLRRVAGENNLSATAFLVQMGQGHELRWFTARCELKLCGHATLASAHVLLNLRQSEKGSVTFNTKFHDALTVRRDGESLVVDLPAMPPGSCATPPTRLREALRLDRQSMEVLEANQTYVAVVDSAVTVKDLRPNFAMIEEFHPSTVTVTAPGTETDYVCRYFAPSYGIPEDAATGSVHCLLGPYWANRLGKSNLHARQLSDRGGEMGCELNGDRVFLKGRAAVTFEGSLSI